MDNPKPVGDLYKNLTPKTPKLFLYQAVDMFTSMIKLGDLMSELRGVSFLFESALWSFKT